MRIQRRAMGVVALGAALASLSISATVAPAASATTGRGTERPPSAVVAGKTIKLGTNSLRHLAVDSFTGRLFLLADDNLLVHDAEGTPITTLAQGGSDVIHAAGSIWVLRDQAKTIVRIDPVTIKVTGSWSLASAKRLVGLAYAGGKIWTDVITEDADEFEVSTLTSINPSTGAKATLAGDWLDIELELAGSPNGQYLLVADDSISSGDLWLYDVNLAEPEVVQSGETAAAFPHSMRFTPDGLKVELASNDARYVEELTIPDLESTGVTYPGGNSGLVSTATTTGSGGLIAATYDWDHLVKVYKFGAPSAILTLSLPYEEFVTHDPIPDGTAFSPDGSKLYVGIGEKDIWEHPQSLLQVIEIGPKLSTAPVAVLGTRGGGRVTFTGTGLTGGSAYIDGVKGSSTASTSTSVSINAPVLAAGTRSSEVRNAAGIGSAGPKVTVVDLGPFRDGSTFIGRQYTDIALRSATGTDQSRESGDLRAGQPPGTLVVDLVRGSAWSGDRAPLIRLYKAVFLRAPDSSGMGYWLGKVQSGTSLTKVAATMAGSSEFKNRYGSLGNGPFVDLIYQNVLGRPPDPGGRSYWVNKLGSGTSRGVLVNQFAQSSENVRKRTDEVEIITTYLALLRRVPAGTELTAALQRRTDGVPIATIATELLRSTEYKARIG